MRPAVGVNLNLMIIGCFAEELPFVVAVLSPQRVVGNCCRFPDLMPRDDSPPLVPEGVQAGQTSSCSVLAASHQYPGVH